MSGKGKRRIGRPPGSKNRGDQLPRILTKERVEAALDECGWSVPKFVEAYHETSSQGYRRISPKQRYWVNRYLAGEATLDDLVGLVSTIPALENLIARIKAENEH
jgi:hypothetical protein